LQDGEAMPTLRNMGLYEIKIEIPAGSADGIDECLQELETSSWSLLEEHINRRAWLVGIFENEEKAWTEWKELRPRLPIAPAGSPEGRLLADQDWRDSYKAHFKAWRFGRLHWVPIWEKKTFSLPPGEKVLWLDPGLAFGTGNHETTRLCVERLVTWAAEKGTTGRVIDAGCGSGILALSAALLGFRTVTAFDNDPEAVRVSEENAALNNLAGQVRFLTGDLHTGLAGEAADLLLANIQADVLMRFAKELIAGVRPDGALILSGILASERDRVRDVFAAAAPNWRIDSRILGEWSDLALFRLPV
jgi:ribosomal protein L11 methyltransferase